MEKQALAIVMARQGEKAKNTWMLGTKCLLEWVLSAARSIDLRGFVSTDTWATSDSRIPQISASYNFDWVNDPEVVHRVEDVVNNVLGLLKGSDAMPEVAVLLQPTSPFIRPQTIQRVIDEVSALTPGAQSIWEVPHAVHWANQRWYEDGRTDFVNRWDRLHMPTKQSKPKAYAFGGVLAFHVPTFLSSGGTTVWQRPAKAVPVPWWEGFDVDSELDLRLANEFVVWEVPQTTVG